MSLKSVEIAMPSNVWEKLLKLSRKTGFTVEDIIMRGILKVIDELEKFMERRKKLAQNDGEKRFWRLRQPGEEKERIVIAYLDIMPLISKILLQKNSSKLINFIDKSTMNLSMALSLIPTFILQLE